MTAIFGFSARLRGKIPLFSNKTTDCKATSFARFSGALGRQAHLIFVSIGIFKQAKAEFFDQHPGYDLVDFFFADFGRVRSPPADALRIQTPEARYPVPH